MTLEKTLLNNRLNDFEKYSTAMPINAKLISKSFANAIGASSGKLILAYNSMFTNIAGNCSIPTIVSECSKVLDDESKVKFMKFDARLCSLVALTYSGFMNAETNFYSELMNDLKGKNITSDNITYELRSLGVSNSEKYEKLLSDKAQSIYDFGVLMGTNSDKERFNTLTQNMHKPLAKYFNNVVKLHQGNKFFSWPIPFRKYSGIIADMLYHDSASYALQDSIGKDLKFTNPEANNNKYNLIREEVNSILKENTLKSKWQAAKLLPASVFYMSGLNAYASSVSDGSHPNYLGAATTTGAIASSTTTLDDKNDGLIMGFVAFTAFMSFFVTTSG